MNSQVAKMLATGKKDVEATRDAWKAVKTEMAGVESEADNYAAAIEETNTKIKENQAEIDQI